MGNFGLAAKPIIGSVGPGLCPGRRDGESAREGGEGGSPGQNGRDERIANPDPTGPEGGAPTVLGRHGGGVSPPYILPPYCPSVFVRSCSTCS